MQEAISSSMRRVIKKVCLLGDGGVGKSSLIRRFVYDTFSDDYQPTIGTKIVKKTLNLEEQDTQLVLVIWDIMGHRSYMKVPPEYYRGAEGVFVVSDLTWEKTLTNLDYWVNSLFAETGTIPVLFLVNKSDLKDKAAFSEVQVKNIADKFDAPFLYTSAKKGVNVEKAFEMLGSKMIEKM